MHLPTIEQTNFGLYRCTGLETITYKDQFSDIFNILILASHEYETIKFMGKTRNIQEWLNEILEEEDQE